MSAITVIALIIFIAAYVLMMAFQKIRPHVALTAAVIFVVMGSFGLFSDYKYSLIEALRAIDWNVLLMIAGTMGTVSLFTRSKMPNLMSDMLIGKTKNIRWTIVALSLFSGIIAAFVDNVATVLMIAPVALALCKKQKISPVPVIICICISANLQGAATLIGDTTSILLAKAAQLDFMDFFIDHGRLGMFWVVQAGAVVSGFIIYIMFKKEKNPVVMTTRTKVEDKFPSFLLVGTLVSLIAVSFIPYKDTAAAGEIYKPEITNGLICVLFFAAGAVREVLKTKKVSVLKDLAQEIDYYTLLLLAGLFVVIGGIEKAGVIEVIGKTLSKIGGGGGMWSVFLVYTIVVWASVFLSAFIDNIPYVATMLPVIAVLASDMSASGGMDVNPKLLYYGLLCGATLGGNLTPIGASANIAGIGILRKEGHEVQTKTFMKYGVPFTLSAVITGYILIWFIWY